jgi:hypothetical protein
MDNIPAMRGCFLHLGVVNAIPGGKNQQSTHKTENKVLLK